MQRRDLLKGVTAAAAASGLSIAETKVFGKKLSDSTDVLIVKVHGTLTPQQRENCYGGIRKMVGEHVRCLLLDERADAYMANSGNYVYEEELGNYRMRLEARTYDELRLMVNEYTNHDGK